MKRSYSIYPQAAVQRIGASGKLLRMRREPQVPYCACVESPRYRIAHGTHQIRYRIAHACRRRRPIKMKRSYSIYPQSAVQRMGASGYR
jgi:hypothetical protein